MKMLNKEHKIKYGLKIWSIDNISLFKEAVELFEKKEIDFLELYIVPDSLSQGKTDVLNCLKKLPVTIHAPHENHDFDIFKLDDSKVKFFKDQIMGTADLLSSKFIVVHAAGGDYQEIFKEKVEKIKDKRILIENMPKIGLNDEICFGYSYDQLKFIKNCGFDLCLDLAHAVKSALSQKIDYKEFIEKIILELNPSYFHLSNGSLNNMKDEHKNLFDGELDIQWIKKTLTKLAAEKDVYLVFEVPKGPKGLENDIKNMKYFRSL